MKLLFAAIAPALVRRTAEARVPGPMGTTARGLPRTILAPVLVILVAVSACGGQSTSSRTTTPPPSTGVSPTATVPAEPRHIVLDTAPRAQPPEVTRQLEAPPPSSFPPWDGKSTVIYDTQTGRTIDLGPGSQFASFSLDETKAAWTAGGADFGIGTEAFIIDLTSGQRRSLGPGRLAMFLDNTSLAVYLPGDNGRTVFDAATGLAKSDPGGGMGPPLFGQDPPSAPPGYVVDPGGYTSPDVRTFTVRDASNTILFSFDAVGVKAAGNAELAVAAPPVDGRSNIYIVDLPGGAATFVASAIPGQGNWPFSASADAVLWTDGYCSLQQPGPITYFDRKTGQLVRVDASAVTNPGTDLRWVELRPSGLIAAGDFGASYVIDPATMAYVVVLPAGPGGSRRNVSWSDGYRYASHGPYGGHGGLCSG